MFCRIRFMIWFPCLTIHQWYIPVFFSYKAVSNHLSSICNDPFDLVSDPLNVQEA